MKVYLAFSITCSQRVMYVTVPSCCVLAGSKQCGPYAIRRALLRLCLGSLDTVYTIGVAPLHPSMLSVRATALLSLLPFAEVVTVVAGFT